MIYFEFTSIHWYYISVHTDKVNILALISEIYLFGNYSIHFPPKVYIFVFVIFVCIFYIKKLGISLKYNV